MAIQAMYQDDTVMTISETLIASSRAVVDAPLTRLEDRRRKTLQKTHSGSPQVLKLAIRCQGVNQLLPINP